MTRRLAFLAAAWLASAPAYAGQTRITSEVRLHRGTPALFIDGRLTSSLAFFARSPNDARPFVQAGFRIGDFSLPFGWTAPEKYDFAATDALMDQYLKAAPDLLALPRFEVTPGDWWCRDRANGSPAVFKAPCHLSFASAKYRSLALRALRAFIEHLESRYGDRIVGYFPGNSVYGEWLSWNAYWDVAPGAPRVKRMAPLDPGR